MTRRNLSTLLVGGNRVRPRGAPGVYGARKPLRRSALVSSAAAALDGDCYEVVIRADETESDAWCSTVPRQTESRGPAIRAKCRPFVASSPVLAALFRCNHCLPASATGAAPFDRIRQVAPMCQLSL